MGHIDEGDLHLLLNPLQLILHILAQAHVQRAQRLVQQQNLGPVHQRPCDGHPLLLSSGQGGHRALLEALQVDDLQHLHHALVDLPLRDPHLAAAGVLFGQAQAEGHVFKHVEMREQGVSLEHGVHCPLIRRDIIDPHAIKQNVPGGRRQKPAYDPKRGCLAAPAGAQQREEFLIVDIQIDVVEHDLVAVGHDTVPQADQLLGHLSSPISNDECFVSSLFVFPGKRPPRRAILSDPGFHG